jgi:hypothetical protein
MKIFDLLTKDETVFIADGIGNFDIGAIIGANGQGAVHHEFHIAGAGRFHANRRNLFRQISRRENQFGAGEIVIGQEYDLDLILDDRVMIDQAGYFIDEFDRCLGPEINGRGLAAKI